MSKMISVASGFQYSVNIGYDLNNDDKLKNFIPTKSALTLLKDILSSTALDATERARVLVGAYMLKIFFGDMSDAVYNTASYFKYDYEDEWIIDPFVKEMIQDVDKSTVLDSGVIDSPVLGKIPPTGLSGGVKTLILVKFDKDKIFNASTCGDNCAKWLLKIAESEDRTINLLHLMDFGPESFSIHILNTDQIVHSMEELVSIAGEFV